MNQPKQTAARILETIVITAGVGVIAYSVHRLQVERVAYQWYLLAALTVISGSATVKLPSISATLTVSETFVFASMLLFGPAAGTITVALDGLIVSFWISRRRPEWHRALFNITAPAVSLWIAAELFFVFGNVRPLFLQPASVNTLFVPVVLFALGNFALNSWLIALMISFETRTSPYIVWRKNFMWLSL